MTTTDESAIQKRQRFDIDPVAPIDRFQLLDTYAERGVLSQQDAAARIDALATISAGDRAPTAPGSDQTGIPRVSRDGTIKFHDRDGRAPELRKALEATEYRSLTIALGFDDPNLFLQQRFTCYTQTALKIYGDQHELREITPRGHVAVPVGTDRYLELKEQCKVSASLYFVLADWVPDTSPPASQVLMPDGLGFYRLRTTSRHSLRNILGTLQYLSRFTGGRLAGIPLELRITYREASDPKGAKRLIPTWSLAFKPPNGIVLSTRNFAPLLQQAIAEAEQLHVPGPRMLDAPRPETWEAAVAEGPEDEPGDADIERILSGDAPADTVYWRKRWGVAVRGTEQGTDEGRAEWIDRYSEGETKSLAEWLRGATNAEAEQMILQITEELAAGEGRVRREERRGDSSAPAAPATPPATNGKSYDDVYGNDDSDQANRDRQTKLAHAPEAEEEPDPGDMGEAGWGDKCSACGLISDLTDVDGEAVCIDREACEQRQQETDDTATEWLQYLHNRIADNDHTDLATYERRRAVGTIIQTAAQGDAEKSRELLDAMTGSRTLSTLTVGACEEIENQALELEWPQIVRGVLSMLKRSDAADD